MVVTKIILHRLFISFPVDKQVWYSVNPTTEMQVRVTRCLKNGHCSCSWSCSWSWSHVQCFHFIPNKTKLKLIPFPSYNTETSKDSNNKKFIGLYFPFFLLTSSFQSSEYLILSVTMGWGGFDVASNYILPFYKREGKGNRKWYILAILMIDLVVNVSFISFSTPFYSHTQPLYPKCTPFQWE